MDDRNDNYPKLSPLLQPKINPCKQHHIDNLSVKNMENTLNRINSLLMEICGLFSKI